MKNGSLTRSYRNFLYSALAYSFSVVSAFALNVTDYPVTVLDFQYPNVTIEFDFEGQTYNATVDARFYLSQEKLDNILQNYNSFTNDQIFQILKTQGWYTLQDLKDAVLNNQILVSSCSSWDGRAAAHCAVVDTGFTNGDFRIFKPDVPFELSIFDCQPTSLPVLKNGNYYNAFLLNDYRQKNGIEPPTGSFSVTSILDVTYRCRSSLNGSYDQKRIDAAKTAISTGVASDIRGECLELESGGCAPNNGIDRFLSAFPDIDILDLLRDDISMIDISQHPSTVITVPPQAEFPDVSIPPTEGENTSPGSDGSGGSDQPGTGDGSGTSPTDPSEPPIVSPDPVSPPSSVTGPTVTPPTVETDLPDALETCTEEYTELGWTNDPDFGCVIHLAKGFSLDTNGNIVNNPNATEPGLLPQAPVDGSGEGGEATAPVGDSPYTQPGGTFNFPVAPSNDSRITLSGFSFGLRWLPDSCPSSYSFELFEKQFNFDFSFFCDFAKYVSYLLIAAASLTALGIVFGNRN